MDFFKEIAELLQLNNLFSSGTLASLLACHCRLQFFFATFKTLWTYLLQK